MPKKIFAILVSMIIMGVSFTMPTSAVENDFYWKTMDKAYVTFLFDDGRMPFTTECFEIFSQYNYPMTCAIVANTVDPDSGSYNKSLVDVLHKIQNAGGEILSHSYSHAPVTSETAVKDPNISTCKNAVYNYDGIDNQFRKSYQVLTKNGFKVGGIVGVGCSDSCTSYADKNFVETITRRYYKYSNSYGVSSQYTIPREWPTKFSQAKSYIDNAIKNKNWIVLSAHQFSTNDSWGNIYKDALIQTLDYIKEKNIEVVNFVQMYEKLGVYSGPAIPSVQMDLTPYPEKTTPSVSSSSTPTGTDFTPYSANNSSKSAAANSSEGKTESSSANVDAAGTDSAVKNKSTNSDVTVSSIVTSELEETVVIKKQRIPRKPKK